MPLLTNLQLSSVIPIFLLLVTISYAVLTGLSRYWRLRHVPGPFLAKFTDLWLAWKIWTKTSPIDLQLDLHERYGPIVRYGPNRVLFSDPSAVPVIFNTKHPLRKAREFSPTLCFLSSIAISLVFSASPLPMLTQHTNMSFLPNRPRRTRLLSKRSTVR